MRLENYEKLIELEKYLEEECYSFDDLTIGKHRAQEGIIIEENNGPYNFAYSERGRTNIKESFSTEKELVDYALATLEKNKWNKAHLVAWGWTEDAIKQAEQELRDRNILFERNDIPNYSRGMTAYRIFVFGKDILLLESFKKRYMKQKWS